MRIESIIKIILPSFMWNWIRILRYKKMCKTCYSYDASRFTHYSNSLKKWDNTEKLIGQIIAEYHVIEKGLAMPGMYLGFGQKTLKELILHCHLYADRFENENEQFLYALRVIAEYKYEHVKNDYVLEEDLFQSINDILSRFGEPIPSKQIEIGREDYFKFVQSSFKDFSNSRHSMRNFSGTIELDLIRKAISLAQNSPSACNRQPARVYVLQDKERIKQVLAIQTGNRGFGHLADKLIVLTAELGGYLSLRERNDVYINGGIYAMNLLYALHYYQIGACPLNWCSIPEQDLKLRRTYNILPSETVILIIACGGVPDNFKIVTSPRNDFSNILKIV